MTTRTTGRSVASVEFESTSQITCPLKETLLGATCLVQGRSKNRRKVHPLVFCPSLPSTSGGASPSTCFSQGGEAAPGFKILGLRPAFRKADHSNTGQDLFQGNGKWWGILELFILNPMLFFPLQFGEKRDSAYRCTFPYLHQKVA